MRPMPGSGWRARTARSPFSSRRRSAKPCGEHAAAARQCAADRRAARQSDLHGLDLLELFALLFPAQFMVPTVAGPVACDGTGAAERTTRRPRAASRRSPTEMLRVVRPGRLGRARRRLDGASPARAVALELGAAATKPHRPARAGRTLAVQPPAAVGRGTSAASRARIVLAGGCRAATGLRS